MAADTRPNHTVAGFIPYGEQLHGDFVRRVRSASEDIESLRQHLVSLLEHARHKQLGLLHRRLNVASRGKVHRLSRRLYRLEQHLRG